MNTPYSYLERYKNSIETEDLLYPYAGMLDTALAHIRKAQKAACVNTAENDDLKAWAELYKPTECAALSLRQRIKDAENFFIGSPPWRIKEIIARMCGIRADEVDISENACVVSVTLPQQAVYTADVYSKYIDIIKPAHVQVNIKRQRTHAQMAEYTHAELAAYTHSGRQI